MSVMVRTYMVPPVRRYPTLPYPTLPTLPYPTLPYLPYIPYYPTSNGHNITLEQYLRRREGTTGHFTGDTFPSTFASAKVLRGHFTRSPLTKTKLFFLHSPPLLIHESFQTQTFNLSPTLMKRTISLQIFFKTCAQHCTYISFLKPF